jgi:FtsH-binding integral membrane protein
MGFENTETPDPGNYQGSINLSKEETRILAAPSKADAEILVDEHLYDVGPARCGALGDCLGWNQPQNIETVRQNSLIRRVMLVVFFQLLIVTIQCGVMLVFQEELQPYVEKYWWVIIIVIVVEFISLFVLFCVRKKRFINLTVLVIFTLTSGTFTVPVPVGIISWSLGFTVSTVVILYDVATVVEAAGICLFLVGFLMIYTLVTRTEVKWLSVGMFLLSFVCLFSLERSLLPGAVRNADVGTYLVHPGLVWSVQLLVVSAVLPLRCHLIHGIHHRGYSPFDEQVCGP